MQYQTSQLLYCPPLSGHIPITAPVCSSLLASIPFSPVTSLHFIVFLSGVLTCSFAISSTSSQFKEWQFAFFFFLPLLLPLVYW